MTYAHATHWITTVVYMLPVVAFLVWLVFVTVRDRMRERGE
jgi:uncharacterized membrane protein YtjA (UPF0391 family)